MAELKKPATTPHQARWLLWCLVMPLLMSSVAAVVVIWPIARAEFLTMQTRWHISQWASGQARLPSLQTWNKAHDQLAAAMAINPSDPQQHEAMAYLLTMRANASTSVPQLMQTFYALAADQYQQSLALRPMSGVTWANLAFSLHYLLAAEPQRVDMFWRAFDKGMAYGQREPKAQRPLVSLALSHWAELSSERRHAVQTLLQELVPPHAQASMRELLNAHKRADLIPSDWTTDSPQ